MLRLVLRLLGVDLDYKLAQIRVQLEEFKGRTTYQATEQVKATGLMVGFAFVGAVLPLLPLSSLYLWRCTGGRTCTKGHSRRSLQWAR
jgi:hypothetical protein